MKRRKQKSCHLGFLQRTVPKRATAFIATSLLSIAACSDGGGGQSPTPPTQPPPPQIAPPPPPTASAILLDSPEATTRFLIQASLGADIEQVNSMVGTDAADFVSAEFAKTCTDFLSPILGIRAADGGNPPGRPYSDFYWEALMEADDTLCQRMTFALSQLLVISDQSLGNDSLQIANYQNILSQNAFGNYRELLEDVTYSPAMAEYLTYLRNRKGDPRTGRMPDENYARELLQLFTIGVVELNMNGTPRLGPGGEQIETFDNDDIIGLARVFTGLSVQGSGFFDNSNPDRGFLPLIVFPEQHSELEKSFLTANIPAGTSGEASITMALDEIFAHPNVPPFVARQLIQRFTASNPRPDYVERVATAFANGTFTAPDGTSFGDGRRGDLRATLAAILLDPSVHGELANLSETDGKVREPILKFIQWARAFNIGDIDVDAEFRFNSTASPADRLAQHPFRSPSVFNFYRPGFVAPGTESGAASLTTPEFQIVNASSALGYINFMTDFVLDRTGGSNSEPRFTPDYSTEIALADDPEALVAHLNLLLTGSRMTDEEIMAVEEAVSALIISDPDRDLRQRAIVAILMIVTGPSYAVIR